MTTQIQLIKRTVVLFPRTDYTDPETVRSNRKKYLEALAYLRTSGQHSKWILDVKVERKH